MSAPLNQHLAAVARESRGVGERMERGIDDRAMPPGGEVSGTDRAVSPVADVAMAESALDVEELL
ncbi:MAG: hypothetical protein QOE61_15, partial [Micromonosporaceae bacterium]|nr:hypothetical protein [Micromonosporaceae bacterium]